MKYFSGLAGLKSIAAFSIVLYHLNQLRPNSELTQLQWDYYQFIETWTIAVSFFFIVSGFFVGKKFIELRRKYSEELNAETGLDSNVDPIVDSKSPIKLDKGIVGMYFSDLAGRLWRLLPPFFIVLIISLIADIWFFDESISAKQFFSSFLLLGPFIPEGFFPSIHNGPLWYIAFDVWCYIIVTGILSAGLWFSQKTLRGEGKILDRWQLSSLARFWGVVLFGVLLLLIAHYCSIHYLERPSTGILSQWFGIYNIWIFSIHYICGVILAEIMLYTERYQKYISRVSDIVHILLWYGLFHYLWGIREVSDFDESLLQSPFHFPYATAYLLGIIFTTHYLRYTKYLLENPITRFIANISYSTYLLHGCIIACLGLYFTNTHTDIYQWWKLATITCIATIILGYFFNKFIEQTNWKKLLFK